MNRNNDDAIENEFILLIDQYQHPKWTKIIAIEKSRIFSSVLKLMTFHCKYQQKLGCWFLTDRIASCSLHCSEWKSKMNQNQCNRENRVSIFQCNDIRSTFLNETISVATSKMNQNHCNRKKSDLFSKVLKLLRMKSDVKVKINHQDRS